MKGGKEGNQLAKTYPEKSVLLHAPSTYMRACVCEVRISFGEAKRKNLFSLCSFFTFIKMYKNGRGEMLLIISGSVSTGRKITGRPSRKPKIGRSQTRRKEMRRTNIHLVRRLHGAFDFLLRPPHAAAFVAPNGRRVEKFHPYHRRKWPTITGRLCSSEKGRRGCPVSRSIHFSMNYDRGRPERTWGLFFPAK